MLVLVFAAVACVSSGPSVRDETSVEMKSWMGQYESDLIASWGPPDQETAVENGAKVLTYYRELWYVNDPLPCDDLYPTTNPSGAADRLH